MLSYQTLLGRYCDMFKLVKPHCPMSLPTHYSLSPSHINSHRIICLTEEVFLSKLGISESLEGIGID
jgi:hypothetical protein